MVRNQVQYIQNITISNIKKIKNNIKLLKLVLKKKYNILIRQEFYSLNNPFLRHLKSSLVLKHRIFVLILYSGYCKSLIKVFISAWTRITAQRVLNRRSVLMLGVIHKLYANILK